VTTASDQRIQQRTALLSIGAAGVLVGLKLGTGLLTGSLGLISAGVESSGDVIAAIFTFLAIRLGARPADEDHPYGHRRVENLAALAEAAILTAGGVVVVSEAVDRLSGGGHPYGSHASAYVVIGIALVIDASRVVVSARTAKRFGSAALRSNAFHFAADMAGSFAVLIGLLFVSAGWEAGDAFAALVVACIIFAAAVRLISENASVLMDRSPPEAQDRAERAIGAISSDVELQRLRIRESAGRFFADAVVTVPPGQAVVESHQTADEVEAAVRSALPDSDVVVHVEPRERGLDLRDRVLAAALGDPEVREAHDIQLYQHREGVIVALHVKLPHDLSLAQADEAAGRVERAIRHEPEVAAVQIHLEPLEQPLPVRNASPSDSRAHEQEIARLVESRLGHPPAAQRLVETDQGLVVLLTVELGEDVDLAEAHEVAGQLEEQIREQRPGLAEVVVTTRP
jgi:cation diffusion facilitator family transporter